MRIYVICPVRKSVQAERDMVLEYVMELESQGHNVFLPFRDAPQTDPTGYEIVVMEINAIFQADRIDVFWKLESGGSHFDLGAAVALGKCIKIVHEFQEDGMNKSYMKVVKTYMDNRENG